MILFFSLLEVRRLKLLQKEKGYRSSLDPILLADFISAENGDRIIDLGTGNGIIAVLLALRYAKTTVIGIDIQNSLIELARKNVKLNNLQERVEIKNLDIRDVNKSLASESFDIVVGNPPYRKHKKGRLNPDPEKALARHELEITLDEYLKASKYLVKNKGKIILIYHPSRLMELLNEFEHLNIRSCRIQFIHSRIDKEAKMVMVEGIKNGKNDTTILKPLIVYEKIGEYSQEIRDIYKRMGI